MQTKKVKKSYPLHQSPFFKLNSKRKLAELLFLSNEKKLIKLASNASSLYIEEDRPSKKKGKLRHIEEPKRNLKRIHKRIESLLKCIDLPEFIHCPRSGGSIHKNACTHLGNGQLYKVDVRRYFASTPKRKVYHFFHKRMLCSPDVAGILASICTFKDHLPTGSPVSPILSYYANLSMWEDVAKVIAESDCKVTVWMDDITVSDKEIPSQVIWLIKKSIKRNGLSYHKTNIFYSKEARKVTGVIIKNDKTMAPKGQHRKLYNLKKKFFEEREPSNREEYRRKIEGLSAHIKQIEKK